MIETQILLKRKDAYEIREKCYLKGIPEERRAGKLCIQ